MVQLLLDVRRMAAMGDAERVLDACAPELLREADCGCEQAEFILVADGDQDLRAEVLLDPRERRGVLQDAERALRDPPRDDRLDGLTGSYVERPGEAARRRVR